MWNIKEFNTPKDEEVLVVYFDDKENGYVKITRVSNCIMRYLWDGYSEGYGDVKVGREVKIKSSK